MLDTQTGITYAVYKETNTIYFKTMRGLEIQEELEPGSFRTADYPPNIWYQFTIDIPKPSKLIIKTLEIAVKANKSYLWKQFLLEACEGIEDFTPEQKRYVKEIKERMAFRPPTMEIEEFNNDKTLIHNFSELKHWLNPTKTARECEIFVNDSEYVLHDGIFIRNAPTPKIIYEYKFGYGNVFKNILYTGGTMKKDLDALNGLPI